MPPRLEHCVYAEKGFKRQLSRSPGIACSVAPNASQSGDYSTLSAPAFTRGIRRHAWIRLRGAATNEREPAERRRSSAAAAAAAHFDTSSRGA